jgi:hypothetical protein
VPVVAVEFCGHACCSCGAILGIAQQETLC